MLAAVHLLMVYQWYLVVWQLTFRGYVSDFKNLSAKGPTVLSNWLPFSLSTFYSLPILCDFVTKSIGDLHYDNPIHRHSNKFVFLQWQMHIWFAVGFVNKCCVQDVITFYPQLMFLIGQGVATSVILEVKKFVTFLDIVSIYL